MGNFIVMLTSLTNNTTYVNTDLVNVPFILFQNGLQRYLLSDEYAISGGGGFILNNELTSGDAIILTTTGSSTDGGNATHITVATYAAMIIAATGTKALTIRVLNDEDKLKHNTQYTYYTDGTILYINTAVN